VAWSRGPKHRAWLAGEVREGLHLGMAPDESGDALDVRRVVDSPESPLADPAILQRFTRTTRHAPRGRPHEAVREERSRS
jgi:hypothetical protein